MSRCFASSSKLSAKEYINKKANFNMFCDLRTKFISNGFKSTGTNNACLNENGIILIHRYKKDNIEISSKLNVLDIRKYGISKIVIGD